MTPPTDTNACIKIDIGIDEEAVREELRSLSLARDEPEREAAAEETLKRVVQFFRAYNVIAEHPPQQLPYGANEWIFQKGEREKAIRIVLRGGNGFFESYVKAPGNKDFQGSALGEKIEESLVYDVNLKQWLGEPIKDANKRFLRRESAELTLIRIIVEALKGE